MSDSLKKKKLMADTTIVTMCCDYIGVTMVLLTAIIFSGCASIENSEKILGFVTLSPYVNPDHQGRPSPVEVKIYQLREVNGFDEADFFSLYDNGPKVLGKDLISVIERELQPGTSYEYMDTIDADVRYIAVLAAFRNIEQAQWRMSVKLPNKRIFDFRHRTLQINLSELSVTAAILVNRKL